MSALHGYGIELDAEVTVREVSAGGFSVESRIVFTPGSEHTFLFTRADGSETMVRCQCRHSKATGSEGDSACVAGFEFLPQPRENLEIILETIARLRARGGAGKKGSTP